MQILLATAVVMASLVAVVWPFVRPPVETAADGKRAVLEIAKEAKYREIRDLQLDHKAGKLSDDDFRATDDELRREAGAILAELDSGKERGAQIADAVDEPTPTQDPKTSD
ncbi:MAG: hypothetical protein JHC87_05855 [Thermoleophilaceae bacterium]|nr:hypothetical protein [Thermoleophilaceae bacterium]